MRSRARLCLAAIAILGIAIAASVGAPAAAAAQQRTAWAPGQRAVLHQIAADTWRFYGADVDPVTHLPLDNLGPGAVRGTYTSAADIGVYLWAVVSAHDLGLIDRARADSLISATLDEVTTLKRYDGFLHQWYETNNRK